MIRYKNQTVSMELGNSNFVEWYVTNYSAKKSTIVNELLKRGISSYIAEKGINYLESKEQPPLETAEEKEEVNAPEQSEGQLEQA